MTRNFVRQDVCGERYGIGTTVLYHVLRRQRPRNLAAAIWCFVLAAAVLVGFFFFGGCGQPGDAVCDRVQACECADADATCTYFDGYLRDYWKNYESCWLGCFDQFGCGGVCAYSDIGTNPPLAKRVTACIHYCLGD